VPDIGVPELLIIALVVFLLFGAQRLPKLSRSLGQSIRGFKQGLNDDGPLDDEELAASATDGQPVAGAPGQPVAGASEQPAPVAAVQTEEVPESSVSA
jgi:sec-independent protein translocase protein TatA